MPTGTLKFFDPNRGYGFIIPDDGDDEVLLHQVAVGIAGIDHLISGQRLQYETTPDRHGRGLRAKNIALAST